MPTPLVTPMEKLEYSLALLRYLRDLCNTTQIPQLAALAQGLSAVDLSTTNPNLPTQLTTLIQGPLRQALASLGGGVSTAAVQFGVTTS